MKNRIRERFDCELKVRIPRWLRESLDARASREDLDLSDIARKALKDYAMRPARSR